MSIPSVRMNDERAIPQLGFGVFQVPPEQTVAAVTTALDAGYRSVDTAALYKNEAEVGEALRASGLPRDEVFVTTKVWNTSHGYDATLRAFDASIGRLGIDDVDLYLIHWPAPQRDRYADTWRALVHLREQGRARSVGVSNFQPEHLRRIVAETGVTPAVNQIELHPYFQQRDLLDVHEELGIRIESWSPLGRGVLLADPVLADIAAAHGRTAAQIVLRWHVQLGYVAIPRSVTPSRIRENAAVFGFELTDEQMARIAALDRGMRIGPHPDALN